MNNLIKTLLVLSIIFALTILLYKGAEVATEVKLPESGTEATLYAGQARDDLLKTYLEAIHSADTSILLIIYSLNDATIINALKEKGAAGKEITVICDGKATHRGKRRLGPNVKVIPIYGQGLMHLKVMVVDHSTVLLGSANMTRQSLRMHGNLVIGFNDKNIAALIEKRAEEIASGSSNVNNPYHQFITGGQHGELWFLPSSDNAVKRVIDLLDSAKKTMQIAMFTWTRRDFAESVIRAKLRGVDVQVAMDNNASKGAGSRIAKLLDSRKVPLRINTDIGLLHHKFVIIDSNTLMIGSANWTKAAFTQNQDCFIILNNLNTLQNQKLNTVWKTIMSDSQQYRRSHGQAQP